MNNENTIKIGIVLNYKKAEKKKDELINLSSRRFPWLSLGYEDFYKQFVIYRNKKPHVPADVAIGIYLESKYPNVVVDYITPEEISVSRFKKNDLVFIIIYDLVESFHLSDQSKFKRFKNVLKNSTNVYPPYEYQKFINNKCTYYKYLENKNIPVAPTHCVNKKKWYTRDPEGYVSRLFEKFKHNKWDTVIAKPVYGQESIDFSKFNITNSSKKVGKKNLIINNNSVKLNKYLNRVIPKYNSIVIQEYIKGFDKNNPEIRMYYINGKYMYSIITTSTRVASLVQEGGTFRIPDEKYKYLLSFSREVLNALPKIKLGNSEHSPILTRIDIGSGLESSKYGYFINEIEFVPSLYVEDQKNPVIEEISEGLMETAEYYKNNKSKIPLKTVF